MSEVFEKTALLVTGYQRLRNSYQLSDCAREEYTVQNMYTHTDLWRTCDLLQVPSPKPRPPKRGLGGYPLRGPKTLHLSLSSICHWPLLVLQQVNARTDLTRGRH